MNIKMAIRAVILQFCVFGSYKLIVEGIDDFRFIVPLCHVESFFYFLFVSKRTYTENH